MRGNAAAGRGSNSKTFCDGVLTAQSAGVKGKPIMRTGHESHKARSNASTADIGLSTVLALVLQSAAGNYTKSKKTRRG
jgi:hypothetical protein